MISESLRRKDAVFYNASVGFRYDWMRRLEKALDIPAFDGAELAEKIAAFQAAHDLDRSLGGMIDASTRLALIDAYPQLRIQMTGRYTQSRTIIDCTRPKLASCSRLWKILTSQDHFVSTRENVPQIVAIRGVESIRGKWVQTDSAKRFAENPCGSRDHLSADKLEYADSLIAVMWNDEKEKYLFCTPGCVNPCSVWPHGTAHLCCGQYFFRLGRHRTREADHMAAVRSRASSWPTEWIYEDTGDSVQYLALEGTSPVEVVRSRGCALDVDDEDIERAEKMIASRAPEYVDQNKIKINIHTCAENHASSLGCQNIVPENYAYFMKVLLHLAEIQRAKYGFALDIAYSLIDASMIPDDVFGQVQ